MILAFKGHYHFSSCDIINLHEGVRKVYIFAVLKPITIKKTFLHLMFAIQTFYQILADHLIVV